MSTPTRKLFPLEPTLGYWSMSEGGGSTLYDLTFNKNHGIITNGTWVDGQIGKALDFDGSSTTVSLQTVPILDYPFTFTCWINHRFSAPYASGFIFNSNQCFLRIDASSEATNRIAAFVRLADATVEPRVTATNILPNTWNHIGVTFDGTTLMMYSNGAFRTQSTRSGHLASSTTAKFGTTSWLGSIQHVKMWDRVLSADEMLEDFFMGARGG